MKTLIDVFTNSYPSKMKDRSLAAQAGSEKSWERDFRVYTENNVEGTRILLEPSKEELGAVYNIEGIPRGAA